jgi:hypothetical protein
MALRGEFGDCGLEARAESILKKSPADVGRLFGRFLDVASKLEKRSRDLTIDQLYELQQELGLVINQFQKDVYQNLAKARGREN